MNFTNPDAKLSSPPYVHVGVAVGWHGLAVSPKRTRCSLSATAGSESAVRRRLNISPFTIIFRIDYLLLDGLAEGTMASAVARVIFDISSLNIVTGGSLMKRTFVVLNAASGAGSDEAVASRVRALFESAGMPAEVLFARGAEISSKVSAAMAQHAELIVAGGGDGTVSAVASALVGSKIGLGVLPLGTLNHFAKDLGLPLDLESAVQSIVTGRSMRIDVGEVNGRAFINNSSVGLYADIVHDREQQQRRLGRGKWPALVWASMSALRRYPFLNVRLSVQSDEHLRRTPFVFIGNNEYQMEGFALGERKSLAQGQLSLYVAQRPGRWRLVQLAMRALVGRLKQARDFDIILGSEIVVESRHRRLRVAADGEIAIMSPPLHYRIRSASLVVIGASPRTEPTA